MFTAIYLYLELFSYIELICLHLKLFVYIKQMLDEVESNIRDYSVKLVMFNLAALRGISSKRE